MNTQAIPDATGAREVLRDPTKVERAATVAGVSVDETRRVLQCLVATDVAESIRECLDRDGVFNLKRGGFNLLISHSDEGVQVEFRDLILTPADVAELAGAFADILPGLSR